jgi:hypothetical protein
MSAEPPEVQPRPRCLRTFVSYLAAPPTPPARCEDDGVSDTFVNVNRPPEGGPYACPRCRFVTLSQRGYYEICPVCFWEDEGQDDHDANEIRGGPNRALSLTQARRNFVSFGASDERSLAHVRAPLDSEQPFREHQLRRMPIVGQPELPMRSGPR